jgi:hypothetical protein
MTPTSPNTRFLLCLFACAAATPSPGQIIGSESFDYADGKIAGQAGGSGFNRDHFHGKLSSAGSDWDNVVGAPIVSGSALFTDNSSAKREYNGPIEGTGSSANDGQDHHERSGAVRATGRVFYRVTMTRGTGTTWSGASSYDFGSERMFFGVPAFTGPGGTLEFGCGIDGNYHYSGIPADTKEHTLVAVLDFDHDFVGLWVDPDDRDFYDPLDGTNSADAGGPYPTELWSTAVRLASSEGGATKWDDLSVALDPASVGLKSTADADQDGLPASFEVLHDLNDRDPGGPNGATGDPDDDGLDNLTEYRDGTAPNAGDSDMDGLDDQREKTLGTDPLHPDSDRDGLSDSEEIDIRTTAPRVADSDGDGTADSTEVALGMDPLKADDSPAATGNRELVALDFFDGYTEGTIAGFAGGQDWDYDNVATPETFIGHTTMRSPWINITGAPVIQDGTLITRASAAKRAFHGGSTSPLAVVGEKSGSWNGEVATGSEVLYVKAKITRQDGVTWSGVSLYEFDTEQIFIGVPSDPNPQSGQSEFAMEHASDRSKRAFSGVTVEPGTAFTLVVRLDFKASRVELRVNPDLSAEETASPVVATLDVPAAEMKATGIRLGSGGNGTAVWDELVVGTTWQSLRARPAD